MDAPDPVTIFIVDDDRGLQRLIGKSLQREGYDVATAISGAEAMDWLSTHEPGLMLLDLKLQDIEGKELINHLEATRRVVPFIIITGQGDERVAVEMMKRGALDYLVKDAQFSEFLPTVVRRALQQVERDQRLAESERERKNLERQILEVTERERRSIGQDLHDGLGQYLTGIELMLQAVASELKTDRAPLDKISAYLRESIRQSKALARGLSPVELQENGLMSALEELASNVSAMFRVRCAFRCPSPVLITDNVAATHLFRIAQEAVSNAIKHGQARKIEVELVEEKGKLLLRIRDDGQGLPADKPQGRGMGLRIMKYRAEMLGGTLSVENKSENGAVVTCSAPDSLLMPGPK
jgi:signal transduction histidine kinase